MYFVLIIYIGYVIVLIIFFKVNFKKKGLEFKKLKIISVYKKSLWSVLCIILIVILNIMYLLLDSFNN